MFIIRRSCAAYFVLVVVYNFVILDAHDVSGKVSQIPKDVFAQGVAKDGVHLNRTKPSKTSKPGKKVVQIENCLLLDLVAVLFVQDPQNSTNIKHTNISISKTSLPNMLCPIEPVWKPRTLEFMASYPYKLGFTAKKRRFKDSDGTKLSSWYVDFFKLSYTPSLVFGDSYNDSRRELTSSQHLYFMETPHGMSFSCLCRWKVMLYNNDSIAEAELHFKTIQMQVFHIGSDCRYSEDFPCSPDPTHLRALLTSVGSNSVFVAITWLHLVVALQLLTSW